MPAGMSPQQNRKRSCRTGFEQARAIPDCYRILEQPPLFPAIALLIQKSSFLSNKFQIPDSGSCPAEIRLLFIISGTHEISKFLNLAFIGDAFIKFDLHW